MLELGERRYRRQSLLIGIRIPTELRHSMIAEPALGDAIPGRIGHNAYHIELDGECQRREVRLMPLDGAAVRAAASPVNRAPASKSEGSGCPSLGNHCAGDSGFRNRALDPEGGRPARSRVGGASHRKCVPPRGYSCWVLGVFLCVAYLAGRPGFLAFCRAARRR